MLGAAIVAKQRVSELAHEGLDVARAKLKPAQACLSGSLRADGEPAVVSFRGRPDRLGEAVDLFLTGETVETSARPDVEITDAWPLETSRGDTLVTQPWMDAICSPVDAEQYLRQGVSENVRRNVRKAKKAGFRVVTDSSRSGADRFYAEMFEPMIRERFGERAMFGSLDFFQSLNGRTMDTSVLFFERDGDAVAGMALVSSAPRALTKVWAYGMRLSELVDSKRRAVIMAALNAEAVRLAAESGHTLNFGLTRPLQNDGVNVYKRRWGATIVPCPQMARYRVRLTQQARRRLGGLLTIRRDGVWPIEPPEQREKVQKNAGDRAAPAPAP